MTGPLCSLRITHVGKYVENYLQEQKLILFADSISDEIAMYCAVHQGSELTAELLPGQIIKINQTVYQITAVGSLATENLKQLGHITLNFDAAVTAELPGMVHICGKSPQYIHIGDRISFCHDIS